MKTSDLARYDADKNLIFVGRDDFRIKIAGQLVVPEGIEAAIIRANEHVKACVVRKDNVSNDANGADGYEYLSCHVLAPDFDATKHNDLIRDLTAFCQQNFPSFMVPTAWKIYDLFPLLPTGKINRKQFDKLERTYISSLIPEILIHQE